MIYATITMTVKNAESKCNEKIHLCRGDKNVELRFVLKEIPFVVTDTIYAQMIIKRSSARSLFTGIAPIENNIVTFTITEDLIDELKETGPYTFQIRLFDSDMNARVTLPPCADCLIVERPIATEGEALVNVAMINDSEVLAAAYSDVPEEEIFTEDNEYNRTVWMDGDIITDARMNKIENALWINTKNITEILLKILGGGDIAPSEKEILETYNIFVPQNVSDEWNTHGTGSSGDSRVLNMSTAEFLELFYDGFVTTPPSGMTVTKTSIGKDESGQYDMWEYDFKPTNYSRTILLSSGMHTYELSASFGLANFIGHLYTDTDNEAFEYIRKNVRIKVIPIVNPWGFNQNPKTYGNVNGVNPSRNFDLDGAWSSFPTYTPSQNEWNVKGSTPFTEAEAVNLAKWALDNWNAEFWIDCHTGLGYADKDLWVYYMSDSSILDRINGGISKIETWFKKTYGSDCVTTRTINSEGSIRLHWGEQVAGIAGMTLEQAPHRTTFGTAENNDSGDISNYSTNISTFVQEFLLEKYRDDLDIPITSVSASDVLMAKDEVSKTVEVAIVPTNTTQKHFKWESSDENVVEVYGGTRKAVLVSKGAGTATITLTNRYNNSVTASFEVEVLGLDSYTITNNLTNVTSDNSLTSIESGASYVANLTANIEYIRFDVKVVMGGQNITSTSYSNGVVSIDSVTGDVIITATALNNLSVEVSSGSISVSGEEIERSDRFRTGYIELENPSGEKNVDYELSMVSISSTNGLEAESTTRCSTSFIPISEYETIKVDSSVYHSYLVRFFKYENGDYTFLGAAGAIWNQSEFDLGSAPKGATHIRLVFRGDSTGESTITNIEPSNTIITLSLTGVAIELELGSNYAYYIRFYDESSNCYICDFVQNPETFSGNKDDDGRINGTGTLFFKNENVLKYIRFIGSDAKGVDNVIDVSTITGSIIIDGIGYDLVT